MSVYGDATAPSTESIDQVVRELRLWLQRVAGAFHGQGEGEGEGEDQWL